MNYQSLCLITKYLVLNYMYFYGPNLAMLQNFICCKIQGNRKWKLSMGPGNGADL
jgi:hypothetical protein